MMFCLGCGNYSDEYLCDKCKSTINIEDLCHELIAYNPETSDKVWLKQIEAFETDEVREQMIFSLCEYLPTPRKEYIQICTVVKNGYGVRKAMREWLYSTAPACINAEQLSEIEQNSVKGFLLDALYNDYRYMDAEILANELMQGNAKTNLHKQTIYTLGKYYTYTRRYEQADSVITYGKTMLQGTTDANYFDGLFSDMSARQSGAKKAYEPNAKENREEAKNSYYDFLKQVGIPVPKRKPRKIEREDYPELVEEHTAGFTSFVAFDFETTGLTPADKITEIGAIKVIDGKVVEEKQFTFQELVNTEGKIIPDVVVAKTGITNEMVKDARCIWEIFPEFAAFIEDYPLVGFNCKTFDNRFLISAGCHSNCVIKNKYFDVMLYANNFKHVYPQAFHKGKVSLERLSAALHITNNEAHRALSDAITTAKVYLKLINQ